MNRLIALAMILTLPSFARADMGLPGDRRVPVTVTITVEHDHPDHEIFLIERDRVERIRLTPAEPLILRSEDNRTFGLTVHVVPKEALRKLEPGALPAKEWLGTPSGSPEVRKYWAGSLHEKGRVGFSDNRERIEKTYLLNIHPDSCRLELVSENAGNKLVSLGWFGLCCVLPPVAIAAFGIWLVRKLFRNRS